MADLLGIDRRINKNNPEYIELKKGNIPSNKQGSAYRVKRLKGELLDKNGNKSMFNQEKYSFFLDAPFEISDKCCNVMKKQPSDEYTRLTGRKPILATMASESKLRTAKWLQEGCNAFEAKKPKSKPMSFWTEQDVLLYIELYIKPEFVKMWEIATYGRGHKRKKARKFLRKHGYSKIGIASVYGDIVKDYAAMGQTEGQLNMAEFGIFDLERPLLKTTECKRTGCMFCGYGCHLEKSPNRFEKMKETHPKQYSYIMRGGHWEYRIFNFKGGEISLKHCSQEQIESWVQQNKDNMRFKIEKHGFYLDRTGLGFKEIIDWINEHGNLNIKY